ncbi:DUF5926 family protein [Lolliginicoccus suaedae]|uniref:DUF5926 family protein n=1 Tax=Lolliginicoccus suaedae TaxID=2605429 RepID=UPI0011ECC1C6|nr:DUF5926 family protein [Lolliginicoccus suaedae]
MGKKSKRNMGPRDGSRRAEKIAQRQARLADQPVRRPFEGFAAECDLVAMREFVPSATAHLPGATQQAERPVGIATVLPGAVAAIVRKDSADAPGEALAGLQLAMQSGNPARDLAESLRWVLTAQPGTSLQQADTAASSAQLADYLATDELLSITVHNDFNWWIPEGVEASGETGLAVQRANEMIMPSARLDAEELVAAWWVDAGEKAHLRWVRPEDEDKLMIAMARLHAAGQLTLGPESRFAGSFRTHGLLVPVFDLDPDMHPDEWVAPAVELQNRMSEALAADAPLTLEERRARDGIIGRQVTLR